MRNETRTQFNAFLSQVATLNGVSDATQKFAVDPSIQQKLETKMQESSDFLSRINISGVRDLEEEKLGLGIGGPLASRTDTNAKDRQTVDLSTLDAQKYRCEKTNSDTHIRYGKLDMWAKFADFQAKIRDAIVRRQALDRITVGFNGVRVAANSDRVANPLLQDVNKGWLQHYREHKEGARVLKEVKAGSGKIKVGEGIGKADGYVNLDALVFDIVASLIDPWHQESNDLVVICGRALLHDKYFPLVNKNHLPSETAAADLIISQNRIGNLPAARVPYFPPNALLVTTYDNLSIYWQEGSRRRTVVDNAKRDQIENYESSNDAYVVEDFGAGAFAENIELVVA
ncbi:phage major capsid protein, P2 family [Chitinimonas sp. BJB300]|uniref:phage major capsid protein, P2 family n=1 Tax=Chitinimonas sp. BJB300 TaxID=1559339 RepID=UPI000C0CE70B|nr:phage major capsid protein, P2 family [Chitinimonas sp. BJB300]PHV11326.1 phage major capsid protein, P2 family [Chitinimonas sp. BJB300]TSJ88220.1 phage major capsid protein, P2 family [Chitinimonas sp. BJB300]